MNSDSLARVRVWPLSPHARPFSQALLTEKTLLKEYRRLADPDRAADDAVWQAVPINADQYMQCVAVLRLLVLLSSSSSSSSYSSSS